MNMVLLTALGVGGATVIGAILGFTCKGLSHRFSDIILSFAAGVMLAAAVLGLLREGNIGTVRGFPRASCRGSAFLHT